MNKRPAFLFFPRDWQTDPELRSCSLEARGLWIELMCVMHFSSRRGYLLTGGQPTTARQLANQVGAPEATVVRGLGELEQAGVLARTGTGEIYCRRMAGEGATTLKLSAAANKRVAGAVRDEAGRFAVQPKTVSAFARRETEHRNVSEGALSNDGGSLRSAAGAAPLAASSAPPPGPAAVAAAPEDEAAAGLRAWWAAWWAATEGRTAMPCYDPETGELVAAQPGRPHPRIEAAYQAAAGRVGHEAVLAATRRAIAAGAAKLPPAVRYLEGL